MLLSSLLFCSEWTSLTGTSVVLQQRELHATNWFIVKQGIDSRPSWCGRVSSSTLRIVPMNTLFSPFLLIQTSTWSTEPLCPTPWELVGWQALKRDGALIDWCSSSVVLAANAMLNLWMRDRGKNRSSWGCFLTAVASDVQSEFLLIDLITIMYRFLIQWIMHALKKNSAI